MRLPIARRLAEKFNVPGPDQAILRLTDKKLFSQLIPNHPKTLYFSMNAIPLKEIHHMIDLHGAVVVKPSRGSGALGTIKLQEKLSETEICTLLVRAGLNNLGDFEWLVQAYITGELYSLEGYCIEGKPAFLGFTGRSRIAMTETACHFPRNNDPLIQKNASLMFKEINTLIERSTFKNGYFHCEFLVNDSGAYLIDANFGRMGELP